MQVRFSNEEFIILKQGFEIGDPSGDYTPDEMPVPIDVVTQVRELLATSVGAMDLDPSQASVLEACFMVGTESNPKIADADYDAILTILQLAKANGDTVCRMGADDGVRDLCEEPYLCNSLLHK